MTVAGSSGTWWVNWGLWNPLTQLPSQLQESQQEVIRFFHGVASRVLLAEPPVVGTTAPCSSLGLRLMKGCKNMS